MAILNSVPGLEAYVKIDGVALQEYDDDDEVQVGTSPVDQHNHSRTVTKYVESVTDKLFTVHCNLVPGFVLTSDTISISVHVDGKLMRSPLILKSDHVESFSHNILHDRIERVVEGVKTANPKHNDKYTLQRFRFAKIETCLDDEKFKDVERDTQRLSEVGEIKVTFARSSAAVRKPGRRSTTSFIVENAKVHEKALKGQAKSHLVNFAPESRPTKRKSYVTQLLDGEDFSLAIFRFKYRSRDALKSLLIIERTPSPEPERASASPPPVDINNLDLEQRKQVARFLQGLNGNRGGSGNPGPSIKRERDSNGGEGFLRKKRNSGKSVIIDLTEDSDDDIVESLN